MSEDKVTFGIPETVVFAMGKQGAPLPPSVRPPTGWLDGGPVAIICTEPEARAMAAWLSARSNDSEEYPAVVKLIETTLRLPR